MAKVLAFSSPIDEILPQLVWWLSAIRYTYLPLG